MGKTDKKIQEYFDNINVIGPRVIVDPHNNTARRVVWAVLVLAALGILGYQVYERIDAYVNTTISVTYDIKTPMKQTFPVVTICNLNALKRSYLKQSNFQSIVEQFVQVAGAALSGRETNTTAGIESEMQAFNYTDLLVKGALKLEELVLLNETFYMGERVNTSNFVSVNTPMGTCFKFKPPSPVTAAGRQSGLHIVLNTLLHEYSDISFESSIGFKIFVHQQGEKPDVFNQGIRVTPNGEYDIGISQRVYKFLEYPTGICNGTGRLRYSPADVKYTKYACLDECMTDAIGKECSCFLDYFPRPAQSKVCTSMQEFVCSMRATYGYHMSSEAHQACNCAQECEVTEYTLATFNSKLNDNVLRQMVNALPHSILPQQNGSVTMKTLQDNLAQVWIYFTQLRHERIEQKESYTVWAMLSDVGGALGLFLGSAIFTIFQLVDYMLVYLCDKPKRHGSAISVTKVAPPQRGDPNLSHIYE